MTTILAVSIGLIPLTAWLCHVYASAMRQRAIGQQIREAGPTHHLGKAGTPTMGGVLVLVLWIAAALALTRISPLTPVAGLVLLAGVLFGGIGILDDVLSLRRKHSTGLTGWTKILLSTGVSAILFFLFRDVLLTPVLVPFTAISLTLPPAAGFLLTWFVFLATTNGANLADGLDGLATGLVLIILIGFAVIAPTLGQLSLILPLAGVLLGFLWINAHPAGLFLGDAGSFALGGIVAALALSQGLTFVLPILAGVLVLEAGSVIVQVTSVRLTGVRFFRMSPLHHHFEGGSRNNVQHRLPAPNWAEQQIAMRFWIAQAVCTAIAILASQGLAGS